MKTYKKSFCTLLVFCLAVVMFPKITLANPKPGSEPIIFYQPVGESESTFDLSKAKSSCYLIYERFPQEDFYRVELVPGINNEDVKSIILLGEIKDEYGTFPVTRNEGLGDYLVDWKYSDKYGQSIPSSVTNHFPNLTTVYIPNVLDKDHTFQAAFRFNTTIRDIYYSGSEEEWNKFIEELAKIKFTDSVGSPETGNFYEFKWDKLHPFLTATSHCNAYPELDVTYKGKIITVKIKDTPVTTTTN